jgi:4-hydroxy-tetrahydrodipicolinate synthase
MDSMTRPNSRKSGPHLIAALVTPFTSDHRVDRASLARLVRYLQRGGVDEFFAVGSSGEAPLLDEADRVAILETVREAAPGGVIYAGISSNGARAAIRNARAAKSAGANFAVLMSPYALAFDQSQLAAYCESVADQSALPLAVYHHLRMPTAFAVPTVARLADHPNIVAIKDTNGGAQNRCADMLEATQGKAFKFFQGVESLTLATLEAGGHGCVVAQACIAPRVFRQLFDAWESGDRAAAAEAQRKITALWEIFSRPEVRQSFCHFLHTLKLPLQQRGVIATTAGAMPGAHFTPEYEAMISDFMRQRLDEPVAASVA